MPEPTDIKVYFNFRSPYCYLVSKVLYNIFEDYHAKMIWRPLGGWSGRSNPDRAKVKIPVVRQDVARFTRRLGIPFTPPPIETDPTLAAKISLAAEQEGLLHKYIVEVMRQEWAEGRNIGDMDVLLAVGEEIGLGRGVIQRAAENADFDKQLEQNWHEAQQDHVMGVPSFVVGDQVFWGNDRVDFLREHLHDLRLRRL
ncbi:2-hydroxychromene-2-carboxylate isomerase [Emcibacter nanhaiensis]|uniref:2-hydroxychromene-2-carboxylate isomerase n=1 Tax=Emcibacter nanhaiensis TaxID=1505037 RepID=A0A501PLQ3_9PROT|nr:DsbA family protein [Emcibacter nanhaiensis]TPD60771.1 2-hydroxychromene-2-carboxylate isomerase [Emcibacter nanhaiensis]